MAVTATCEALFGSDAGRGWTEAHKIQVSEPLNLSPTFVAFKNLIDTYRVPLLAADRYVKGLKISAPTPTGDLASVPYRYTPVKRASNKKDGCGPSLAALMRMADITNTRFSPTYLRGFWDTLEANEELDFTTADGKAWQQLALQYVTALVNGGYGWEGLDNTETVRGKVTNYAISAQSFITFTLAPNPGFGLIPGQNISIRFARINHSNSVLNRTLIVNVIDATTVRTVVPIAATAFESEGTFVAEGKTFFGYIGVQYIILARRPEGRPIGLSPARQKARART